MQLHRSSRTLSATKKPDKDVEVLFAFKPERKAVLFIHGFSGSGLSTWSKFNSLLPRHSKAANRDLFFYGYDGLRADLIGSADIFREFLCRLFVGGADFINAHLSGINLRPPDFGYDEFVIAAHSLGAVIARRALVDATKEGALWPQKVRLVLYAPAHTGASVARLALETCSTFSFTKVLAAFLRFKSPLIDQLMAKPKSKHLTQLLGDTLKACKNGQNPHLIAKRVIRAEYENIVETERFEPDPSSVAIPNTTHVSVCKPREDFLEPLHLLNECL
jgi:pimeloyl-ACP methyl ester carboxylesterase